MLIAITGATGFLGRYLVRQLVHEGHRLRCWYRSTSNREGFEAMASSIVWLPGQLGNLANARDLVGGVDAVVHAAVDWTGSGRGHQEEDNDQVLGFLQANLMGTLQLFQSAFAAGVPRLIFISSCAVHEVILDDRPLDEAHPLWANNHYGAYKGAVEKFVHSYGLGKGWPVCSLRPTGIYGLDHPASASRYFDLVGQVVQGQPIASARGGKEVHADDVARAVSLLLQADASLIAGQAFNCYDRYIAEQEVARIARELTGSSSTIADLNRGPKHQIVTDKIRQLGMTFGGEKLLRLTVQELVKAHGK